MRCTLKRDDMPLLSQWIKKFDKSKLVEFFGSGTRVFARGEDTRSLRLTSELVDLRLGYVNPRFAMQSTGFKATVLLSKQNLLTLFSRFYFVQRLRKRYFLRFATRIRTPTGYKINEKVESILVDRLEFVSITTALSHLQS